MVILPPSDCRDSVETVLLRMRTPSSAATLMFPALPDPEDLAETSAPGSSCTFDALSAISPPAARSAAVAIVLFEI